MNNPYKILKVSEDSSLKDISESYKKLIKNISKEEYYKINEAYNFLKKFHPYKRKIELKSFIGL